MNFSFSQTGPCSFASAELAHVGSNERFTDTLGGAAVCGEKHDCTDYSTLGVSEQGETAKKIGLQFLIKKLKLDFLQTRLACMHETQ